MAHARPTPTDGYPEIVKLDRVNVILRITLGLRTRDDGRRWTVRGGQPGERDYGQLVITSPTERLTADGRMTDEDRLALTRLLDLPDRVGPHGAVVKDSHDHYRSFIDRAEGRAPRVTPQEYDWI